jgi:dihydrofolate reductase
MLSLIVARARDGAIGQDCTIPWHAPEDLAFFQRETLGGALIMGRRTWDSLPVKPLKNRLNIVVSSREDLGAEQRVGDVDAALDLALTRGQARLYGIGGAGIYRALLPRADRLLITEVDLEVPGADTFFPEIDPADWRPGVTLPLRAAAPKCVLREWLRIGSPEQTG